MKTASETITPLLDRRTFSPAVRCRRDVIRCVHAPPNTRSHVAHPSAPQGPGDAPCRRRLERNCSRTHCCRLHHTEDPKILLRPAADLSCGPDSAHLPHHRKDLPVPSLPSSAATFSAADDPWIDTRTGPRYSQRGLRDLFLNAHTIDELALPHPRQPQLCCGSRPPSRPGSPAWTIPNSPPPSGTPCAVLA